MHKSLINKYFKEGKNMKFNKNQSISGVLISMRQINAALSCPSKKIKWFPQKY